MNVIKYVVRIQMVYSLNERSRIDVLAVYDTFEEAIEKLENVAQIYANNKNVAIDIVRFKYDADIRFDKYLEVLIGFYGVDAVKYLNIIDSKGRNKNKYGLIVI
jgi:hypothetical protein